MNDEASFRDRRRLQARDADADEDQPIGPHPLREARLQRCAE
jgi:hypothetical protein